MPVFAGLGIALFTWILTQFVDQRVRSKTTELWTAVRKLESRQNNLIAKLDHLTKRHNNFLRAYRGFKSKFQSKGYVFNPDGSPVNVNDDDEGDEDA